MATYHVGGFNPIRRTKTLSEAVEKASYDDIIELHKNINETIIIDKPLQIKGNSYKWTVESGSMGLKITQPTILEDIQFEVSSRANGIVAEANVVFTNIKAKLIGPIVAFYPVVWLKSGKHKFTDCTLTKVYASDTSSVTLNNSTIYSYYGENIETSERDETSVFEGTTIVNNGSVGSTTFYDVTLNNTDVRKFVRIHDGNLNNINLTTKQPDKLDKLQVSGRGLKKEPNHGPLATQTNNDYHIYMSGKVDINNYTVYGKSETLGFYGSTSHINAVNINNQQENIIHKLVKSSISFKDSTDNNFWSVDDTTLQQVRSHINTNSTEKTAMEQLDELIGLDNVKQQLRSLLNSIKMGSNHGFSNHVIFAGDPGTGKAEWVENRIFTPDGEKRFGDLKPGDYVFDENGKPTKVVNIFPQGKLPAYRLTTLNNRSGVYSGEHLWSIIKINKKTECIMKLEDLLNVKNDYGHNKYALPVNKPLQFSEQKLPMNPYTMGTLIANGCLTNKWLTISTNDDWIPHHICELQDIKTKRNLSNYNWLFYDENGTIKTQNTINPNNGLKSHEKFIPDDYLYSSVNQRWSLLQGLMDNDGSIDVTYRDSSYHRYQLRYTTTSPKLKDNFEWLVRSLGYEVSVRQDNRPNRRECYNIHILAPNSDKYKFFRLPRKRKLAYKAKNQKNFRIYERTPIDSIEPLGEELEMMCIQVENPTHLYLSSDMLVTHNTTVGKIYAKALFEVGAIPENKVTFATNDTLVKGYIGQTGENVARILDDALGGVLFIDEAYQLTVKEGEKTFNDEVISVLIRYMEDHRDNLVVIAAGYSKEMRQFLASNSGLSRRFQWIEFDDYTSDEMVQIFELMRKQNDDQYSSDVDPRIIKALFAKLVELNLSRPDANGRITNGGNGGLVRNVYQRITQAKNDRFVTYGGELTITKADIVKGFEVEMKQTLQKTM